MFWGKQSHLSLIVAVGLTLSLFGHSASASVLTWDPGLSSGTTDGGGNWSTANANWWNGSGDANWTTSGTDSAVFGNGGTGPYTVTLPSSVNVAGITFNAGSTYNTSGGTIILGSTNPGAPTGIFDNATGVTSVNSVVSLISPQTWSAPAGGTLAVGSLLTYSAAATYGIGGYNLSVAGAGVVSLTNASDYLPGTISVSSGTLSLQNTNTFGNQTGVEALANGTVNVINTVQGFANRASPMGGDGGGSGVININNAGTGIGGGWTSFYGTAAMNVTGTVNINSGVFASDLFSGVGGLQGSAIFNVGPNGVMALHGAVFGWQIGALNGAGAVTPAQGTSGPTYVLTDGVLNASGSFTGIIHGNNSTAATDGSIEAGFLSLVKVGTGQQSLSGANTYTGNTVVGNGTLLLDFSAASAPASNILPSANLVSLNGGNLAVNAGGGANSQTLGAITVGAGGLQVSNAGGNMTLTAASLTRAAGGMMLVNLSQGAGSNALALTSTAGLNQTSTGVIGWAAVQDAGGTGFGMLSGNNIVRNTATSVLAGNSNSSTTDFTTTPGDPAYSSGTLTLGGAAAADSLSINASSSGFISLGGNTLSLTSSGLLMYGSGNYKISNGQLGASGAGVIVNQLGPGTLTIASSISSGAGTFSVGGGGSVVLTASNGYTGTTYLGDGLLNISNSASLGSAGANSLAFIGNGTLQAGANITSGTRPISIANAATATFDTNTHSISVAGVISGAGGALAKVGGGLMTLTGANTFSGGVTISGGTLSVGSLSIGGTNASNLGEGPANGFGGSISFNGGVLNYTGGNVFVTPATTQSGLNYNITLLSGGGTLVSSGIWGYTGVLAGSGNLTLVNASNHAMMFDSLIPNESPNFTGNIILGNNGSLGYLQLRSTSTDLLGNAASVIIKPGGDLSADTGGTIAVSYLLPNPITLSGGTLSTNTPNLLYAGPVTATVNTLSYVGWEGDNTNNLGGFVTLSGNLQGSGSLVTTGTTGITLSGSNSGFTGVWESGAGGGATLITTFTNPNAGSPNATWDVVGRGFNSGIVGGGTISMGALIGTTGTLNNAVAGTTATFSVGGLNTNPTFGGVIANTTGTTALLKVGTGRLFLNGADTYSGPTTISSGTLTIGNNAALGGGSSLLTVSASTLLDLNGHSPTVGALNGSGLIDDVAGGGTPSLTIGNGGGSGTFSGTIQNTSGVGNLVKTGAGTEFLNGTNTYSGTTSFNGGVVNFIPSALPFTTNPPSLSFTGGTLQWASGNIEDVSAGILPIASGKSALIDTNGNNVTFASSLGGAGGLGLGGAAMLTLTSSNAYTGNTAITTGTLALTGSANLAGGNYSGNIAMASNTDLVLNISGNQTFGGVISGGGSLYQNGSAMTTLNVANTFTGLTLIGGGTLALNTGGALAGSTFDTSGSGFLSFNGLSSGTMAGLQGSGNLLMANTAGSAVNLTVGSNNATTVLNGSLSDGGAGASLTKVGGGTLTLNGTNSYGGGTTIAGGLLIFSTSNALPSTPTSNAVTIAGGYLAVTGPYSSVNGWLGSGLITPSPTGGLALTMSSSENIDLSATGPYSGTYGNLFLGSVGSNTYSGVLTPSGSYLLGGGGGTLNFASSLSSGYPVQIVGPGTVILSNSANNITGSTTVSSGALVVTSYGMLQNSPVTISVANGLQFAAGLGSAAVGSLSGGSGFPLLDTAGGPISLQFVGATPSTTYSGALTGSGSLVMLGPGTQTLTGASTFNGGVALNGGALTVNTISTGGTTASALGEGPANASGQSLTFNGGILNYTGGNAGGANPTVNTTGNNFNITLLSGGGTINNTAGYITLTGSLSGAGNLTIMDTADTTGIPGQQIFFATLTNNASPNFTGNIIIGQGGAIQLRSAATNLFGNAASVVINAGGILQADKNTGSNGVPSLLSTPIVLNGGTLTTQGATMNYTGSVTVNSNLTSYIGTASGSPGLQTLSGSLVGSGTVSTVGTQVVTLSGANSGFTGTWLSSTAPTSFTQSGAGSPNAMWIANGSGFSANIAGGGTVSLGGLSGTAGTVSNGLAGTVSTFSVGALGANTTYGGALANGSGTMALAVVGGGLTLTSVNTYTGLTTVSGGTLQFGNGTAPLNLSTNVLNNSTLIVANAGAGVYTNQISGSGTVFFNGPGTVSLAGSQAYTGPMIVQGGTLSAVAVAPTAMQLGFYGTAADASGNNNNATLVNSPSYATGYLPTAQALSLNGSNQYAVVPYSSSLNLTGAYTVSLWEKGTLVAAASASTGGPALFSTRNGGNLDFDLQVNSAGVHADIGNGSATWLTTAANAQVALGSGWNMITMAVSTSGYAIYVNGSLSGSGTYSGAAPELFSSSAESASVGNQEGGGASYGTGAASVFNGSVSQVDVFSSALSAAQIASLFNNPILSPNFTLPGVSPVSVAAGATLNLGTNETVGSLSGAGTVTNSVATAPTLTVGGDNSSQTFSGLLQNGAGTMSVVKTGSGMWTLGANNTYSGNTTVNGGTLQLGNGGASGSLGTGGLTMGNAWLSFNRSDATVVFSLPITGGTVSQDGTGTTTLTANNTYGGGTFINNGFLAVGNGGNTGTLGSGPIVINSPANSGGLIFSRSDAFFTVANAISGSGAVFQNGSGTVTLSGPQTYNGPTTVTNGNLYINAANATSSISVLAGATVGGTGTASVATATLQDTASIEAGQSGSGSFTLAGLNFQTVSGNNVNINNVAQYQSVAAIIVTGSNGLAAQGAPGSVSINLGGLAPTNTTPQIAHLIQYSGQIQGQNGASVFSLNPATIGQSQRSQFGLITTDPGYIDLQYYTDYPIWTGSGNSTWFTSASITPSGTTNWVSANSPSTQTNFIRNDSVVFNDTAVHSIVNITDTNGVYPSLVTFKNDTLSYTLTGAYGIQGGGAMVLNGSATVSIYTNNGFYGGTTINAGRLNIGNTYALGSASNGATFVINGGSLDNVTGGPLTTDNYPITWSGGFTFVGSNPLNLGNGAVTLGNSSAAVNVNGSTLEIDGAIGDNSLGLGFTQNGAGMLILTGPNSYSGPTVVNGGTLSVGSGGSGASIGNTSVVSLAANTLLIFNHSDAVVFTPTISGSGGLIQTGVGILTLASSETYTGGTSVNGGTLQLNVGGTTGTLAPNTTVTVNTGAALQLNASNALGTSASYTSLTVNSGGLVFANSGNRVPLFGTVNVTGGTLASDVGNGDGNGNYSLSGQLNAASDTLGNPAVISATQVSLLSNTVFNVSRGSAAGPDLVVSSKITSLPGGNGLTLQGNGFTQFSGANTYNGGTMLLSGTLQLAGVVATVGSNTGGLTVSSGALFDLNAVSASVGGLNGGGTIDNVAGGGTPTLTFGNGNASGTYSGTIQNTSGTTALVKTGAGTEILSGTNTYAGGTHVNGGVLNFAPSALGSGPVTFGGGTLQWAASNTLDVSTTPGIAAIPSGKSASLDTNGNSVSFSSSLSGAGGLTKIGAGTLTLGVPNTFTGATNITGGTLNLADPLALQNSTANVSINNSLVLSGATSAVTLGGLSGSGSFNLAAAALTVGGNNSTTTYSGLLGGGASLTKQGSGTLTLAPAQGYSYPGSTLIAAGTLKLLGSGIAGFGAATSGTASQNNGTWQFNNTNNFTATAVTGSTLTLTDNGGSEARSAFYMVPVPVGAFSASFVYQASGSKAADGVAFMLQNSGSGAAALGSTGGALGYTALNNTAGIVNSAGIGVNLYANANPLGTGAGPGIYQLQGGTISSATLTPDHTFFASGDRIQANVGYDGSNNLAATFLDLSTGVSYTETYAVGSLTSLVGSNAYLGFSGGDGGAVATQTIGSFSYRNSNILPATTALSVSGGATLDLAGNNQTVASLSGAGKVTNSNAATLSILTAGGDGTSQTFSGAVLNGVGLLGLTKVGSGSLTLTGSNVYSGGTTVSGGTLQLGDGVGTNGSVSGNIALANNSAVVFANPSTQLYGFPATPLGSVISGSGSFTKNGAGTLQLTANHTYSGPTIINAGTVQLGAVDTSGFGATTGGGTANGVQTPGGSIVHPNNGTWTLNTSGGYGNGAFNYTPVNGGSLDLTDGTATNSSQPYGYKASRSAFYNTPVPVNSSFNMTFTYTASSSVANVGTYNYDNGFAFVIQNDSRGASALAGAARGFGVGNDPETNLAGANNVPIGHSAEINYDLFSYSSEFNNVPIQVQGPATGYNTNGGTGTATGYPTAGLPVFGGSNSSYTNLASDPINMTVSYNAATQTLTWSGTDVSMTPPSPATFSYSQTGVNLQTITGSSMAYIGFTGADGQFGSTQTISNFNFASLGNLPSTTPLFIAAGGSLDLFGANQTVANLSGAGVVTNTFTGTTSTLTTGGDNTSQTFSGALQNGGGVLALTKVGSGGLTLTGSTSNYSGPTTVNAGALFAAAPNALSPNSAISVSGGTLDATAAPQTIAALAVGASGTLNLNVNNLLTANGMASFYTGSTLNLSGTMPSGFPQEVIAYNSLDPFNSAFTTVDYLGQPVPGSDLSYNAFGLFLNGLPTLGAPSWIQGSGNWSAGTNWSSGSQPNGVGAAALLNESNSGAVAITLDVPVTLGSLQFATSTTSYALSGGTLTFNNGGGSSSVTVLSGTHSIGSTVVVSGGNLDIAASSSSLLTISGNVSDDGLRRSLIVGGDGTATLVLSGNNTYGGSTIVNAGTLDVDTSSSLPDGSGLFVGQGASSAFSFAPAVPVPAGAAAVVAVPEPGTLALLAAAFAGAAIVCRIRRRSMTAASRMD
jgi:fibronectin-binding autotransporter adhesin